MIEVNVLMLNVAVEMRMSADYLVIPGTKSIPGRSNEEENFF